MTVAASAPGKLILIGEYGVLFGAPAVVMAVDRRAVVRLDDSEDGLCSLNPVGPGSDPARFTFQADGSLRWRGDADAAGHLLFERVLGALSDSGLVRPQAIEPFTATLDTRAFYRGGGENPIKLGLGSSAALTVALASALIGWQGEGGRPEPGIEWLGRLLHVHRAFQGGRGSGIDLAASLMGGVVEYRLDRDGSVAVAEPVQLPGGLSMVVVWTGRSADTGELLGRLSRQMAADGGRREIDTALDRLKEIATAGVLAVRARAVPAFLTTIDEFSEGMLELGRAAGLDIMSREHTELRVLARRFGVTYKPSGAGGGDIGIGFTEDMQAAGCFAQSVREAGFDVIDISPDAAGLR